MPGILHGIRVVELGSHIAIPKAARMMADWGAEVFKVEPPGGEAWRSMGKEWDLPYAPDNNPVFYAENANKKSVVVNLKDQRGKEVLLALLVDADVFMSNMRPAALKKLGFDYESLKERFPSLVFAYFTAYGEEGPDKDMPGFDSAAFWANSGALLEWTPRGQDPFKPWPGFGDSACCSVIVSGVMAALFNRTRTSRGDCVKCSLYGSALWMNSIGLIMGQPQYGREYPLEPTALPNAFSRCYQTRDGDWIITGTSTWNKHAPGVFAMLGLEQYLNDSDYMDMQRTRSHLEEVIGLLRDGYSRLDTASVLAGLTRIGLVHARLKNPREVSTDEQAWVNGYLNEVLMEGGKKVVLPSTPLQFESMGRLPYELGPPLGRDTVETMKTLGIGEAETAQLLADGVVAGEAT